MVRFFLTYRVDRDNDDAAAMRPLYIIGYHGRGDPPQKRLELSSSIVSYRVLAKDGDRGIDELRRMPPSKGPHVAGSGRERATPGDLFGECA